MIRLTRQRDRHAWGSPEQIAARRKRTARDLRINQALIVFGVALTFALGVLTYSLWIAQMLRW